MSIREAMVALRILFHARSRLEEPALLAKAGPGHRRTGFAVTPRRGHFAAPDSPVNVQDRTRKAQTEFSDLFYKVIW